MPNIERDVCSLLALTMLPGLGPMRARRLMERLGPAEAVLGASQAQLEAVRGIGPETAGAVIREKKSALAKAGREIAKAEALGARILTDADADYPALLAPLPDRPLALFVRGSIEPADRFAAGMVGSRRCSQYGLEQAGRFASAMGSVGVTVVSGGARGIDTAAHRGSLTAGGRTIVVLGCGLSHCYPPENLALFDSVIDGGGAVISELPCDTPPQADNFPARNRLISGLALGVLVIEAGRKSGALITARLAAEEHGREVFALPGRVDSETCAGTLELIKAGGAQLVTEPGDVIAQLETPARHVDAGTHAARYAPVERALPADETGRQVLEACAGGRTPDQVAEATGLGPAKVRQALTMLEISGLVRRRGSVIESTV